LNSVTILALGDLIGSPGRDCLKRWLPQIKEDWNPDIFLVNGENAASGSGMTEKIFLELTQKYGFDVVTTGNHWLGKKNPELFLGQHRNLLLPANMYNVSDPSLGFCIRKTASGVSYAVINLIGRVYMQQGNRCPFKAAQEILARIPKSVSIRIIDMHGEVTSEKQALAYSVKDLVSLCYGTHTHCPTADERIWGDRMGYITDLGMTGAYDSIIGMQKEASLEYFLTGHKKEYEPARGHPWLCGVIAKVDAGTGRCYFIERIRYSSMV
jgi:metallophosphoesterase (TIGR00282 family)